MTSPSKSMTCSLIINMESVASVDALQSLEKVLQSTTHTWLEDQVPSGASYAFSAIEESSELDPQTWSLKQQTIYEIRRRWLPLEEKE